MQGFMSKAGLNDYCISVDDISSRVILDRFSDITKNYELYRKKLKEMHDVWKRESLKTTDMVDKYLPIHES
jgi:hypothetical protein